MSSIILAGLDGSGKTYTAQWLAARLKYEVEWHTKSDMHPFEEYLPPRRAMILDRSFVCELPYARLLGRPSQQSLAVEARLAAGYGAIGAVVVFVHEDHNVAVSRIDARLEGDTNWLPHERRSELYSYYMEALARIGRFIPVWHTTSSDNSLTSLLTMYKSYRAQYNAVEKVLPGIYYGHPLATTAAMTQDIHNMMFWHAMAEVPHTTQILCLERPGGSRFPDAYKYYKWRG